MYKAPLCVSVAVLSLFIFPTHGNAAGTTAEDVLRNTNTQRQLENDALQAQRDLAAAQGEGDSGSAEKAQQALKAIQDALSKMGQGIMDSNFQCVPVQQVCGCNMILRCGKGGCRCVGGANKFMCPCQQPTPVGAAIPGICVANMKCEGQSAPNMAGQQQGLGGASGFQDILKSAMGALQQMMQGGGGGGGGGGGAQQPTGPTGCTSYYQVTTPSSDPCAYYVPPISDSLLGSGQTTDTSSALLDALGSGGSVSQQLSGALNIPVSPTPTPPASTSTGSLAGQAVTLQGGTQGDIQIGPSRATVVATAQDPNANTVVAGFYGSNTLGGEQPQSLAARMCQNRPWSGSVVSYIIPPAFFDSLCTFRGYQVGSPPPAPPAPPAAVQITPPGATMPPSAPPPPPAVSLIPPEVDIWANPAQIPLGSRTTIFWSSKGVSSCAVTSSDGSFDEKTLSGGAATVPLSGATTFTLSCTTPDAKTVIDSVTVNMAI